MFYGSLKKFDIANGTGIRTSLFVSGCLNHCKGCFQPETWDFQFGKEFTEETINEIMDSLRPSYIDGISLLGGDPFEYTNQVELTKLLHKIKAELPNKTVWAYTGYMLEQDLLLYGQRHYECTDELLSMIDILVDGKFEEDKKDISLKFRGSSNQRIIDLQKSLELREIVLHELD